MIYIMRERLSSRDKNDFNILKIAAGKPFPQPRRFPAWSFEKLRAK